MVLDTNLVIYHIRQQRPLPVEAIIPIVVAGELYSFAIQNNWGQHRKTVLETIINAYPKIDISFSLLRIYSEIDAYSQGMLPNKPLLKAGSTEKDSAKNMGKNDLWIASIALALGEELHTSDNDFDHLPAYGLKIKKYDATNPFGNAI